MDSVLVLVLLVRPHQLSLDTAVLSLVLALNVPRSRLHHRVSLAVG
jgi:hypothetical protein